MEVKNEDELNKVYPKNQCGSQSQKVDESFRIDDNADYSTTAMEENKCLDDPMVPGVGVSETEAED
jgi:hypothetical protein